MSPVEREYNRIHKYLVYNYGKASKCENTTCSYPNPKRYEWALKKGRKYSKNIKDYLQLCPSCHRKYDYTEEQRRKVSIATKGRDNGKSRSVSQFTKSGKFIKSYKSIKIASIETTTSRTGIQNCLSGLAKSANEFIWKY